MVPFPLLRIRVFGWKKGKPLAALNYHSATVNCVSFAAKTAPEEHRNALICGSRDQRITLWKLYWLWTFFFIKELADWRKWNRTTVTLPCLLIFTVMTRILELLYSWFVIMATVAFHPRKRSHVVYIVQGFPRNYIAILLLKLLQCGIIS